MTNARALTPQQAAGYLEPQWRQNLRRGEMLELIITLRNALARRVHEAIDSLGGFGGRTQLQALAQPLALHVMDIGAADGINPRWNSLGPAARITMFEPEPAAFAALQNSYQNDSRCHTYDWALSNDTKKLTLNILGWPRSSSVYAPIAEETSQTILRDHFRVARKATFTPHTLAELKAPVDFIKIDVEGHELPILQGMNKEQWENLIGVETEVHFYSHLFQNRPTFADIDIAMRAQGFLLVTLPPPSNISWLVDDARYDGTGFVMASDALYMRRPQQVITNLKSKAWAPAQVQHAAFIYLSYGLIDWSYLLLSNLPATERQKAWWQQFESALKSITARRLGLTGAQWHKLVGLILPHNGH